MINREVYERSLSIIDTLVNKTIDVDPSSILASVVAYSNMQLLFPDNYSKANITPEAVELATNRVNALGERGHTAQQDIASTALSEMITYQLGFLEGPVRKLYEQVTDNAKRLMGNITQQEIGFRIVPVTMPAIYMEESILTAISNVTTEPRDSVTVNLDLSELTASMEFEDILKKFFYTGSEEIDADLLIRVNNYGPEATKLLWEKLYCRNGVNTIITSRAGGKINEFELLFTFVTAYNLANIGAANVKYNGGSYAFDNMLKMLLSALYHSIKAEIENYKLFIGANMLINRVDLDQRVIEVQGPVYDAYFNQGGSLDALLGYAVGDRVNSASIEYLIANTNKLTQRWEAYKAAIYMREETNTYLSNKAFLFRAFEEAMFNNADDIVSSRIEFEKNDKLLGEATEHPIYKDLVKKVQTYIDKLNVSGISAVSETINYIIFSIIYDFTSADFYFRRIIQIRDANPKLSVEQAKFIATVDYLVSYAVYNINIK